MVVSLHKSTDGKQAIVSIKDSGTGIDQEIFPRLFGKFATNSFQGTGLGLFISKKHYRRARRQNLGPKQ